MSTLRNTHPLSAPLGLPHNPWPPCGPGQSRSRQGAAAACCLQCEISSAPGPAQLATSAVSAGLQAPEAARVPGPPPCSAATAQGAAGAPTRAWPRWPASRVLGPAAPPAGVQVSRTRSPRGDRAAAQLSFTAGTARGGLDTSPRSEATGAARARVWSSGAGGPPWTGEARAPASCGCCTALGHLRRHSGSHVALGHPSPPRRFHACRAPRSPQFRHYFRSSSSTCPAQGHRTHGSYGDSADPAAPSPAVLGRFLSPRPPTSGGSPGFRTPL